MPESPIKENFCNGKSIFICFGTHLVKEIFYKPKTFICLNIFILIKMDNNYMPDENFVVKSYLACLQEDSLLGELIGPTATVAISVDPIVPSFQNNNKKNDEVSKQIPFPKRKRKYTMRKPRQAPISRLRLPDAVGDLIIAADSSTEKKLTDEEYTMCLNVLAQTKGRREQVKKLCQVLDIQRPKRKVNRSKKNDSWTDTVWESIEADFDLFFTEDPNFDTLSDMEMESVLSITEDFS